jgi:signal transduction histidine kinase/ActR/RegA family two-component response regulator
MNKPSSNLGSREREFRVLVVMPTGRDGALVVDALTEAGLQAEVCHEIEEMESQVENGVGAVLLAEEALRGGNFELLSDIVQRQPVWSDLPVVLMSADPNRSERLSEFVGSILNITILDRPIQKAILISATKGALRARRRQYQTRDLLVELKEADQHKDLFLATLSHELRTPLNSMLGWIQLLKTERNGLDRRHALEVIERNARAQTQIINDILTLSRVVMGKLEMDIQPIDLNAVIRATIDVVQPLIDAKQLDLQLLLPDNPQIISGDFDRLQQVFWNLFSNAIKFTPDQGVITVQALRDQEHVSVIVADNGKGMAMEFLPFAFERFRQADSSFTRQVGGLGLGLAIVRTIVEQHGGTVAVKSDGEGKGTSFTLRLPLAERTTRELFRVEEVEPARVPVFSRIRVLLAEDDDDAREMMTFMLRQHEIEVEAVGTAQAAMDAFVREPPTILISDVGMPDMDGYAMIKRIRGLPAEQGGQTPAIALTGYAGIQDRARSIKAGYQAHLSKPIDFDDLFDAIERLSAEAGHSVLPRPIA